MNTFVALFRGINVGGKNSLPMKELVAALEKLGCRQIQTYIQSGNVVLKSNAADVSALAGKITAEIKKSRGFAPFVLLLSLKEFRKVVDNNPFSQASIDPRVLHVGFLAAKPKDPDLKALESIRAANERFRLVDRAFYLHAPDGIGRSKLAAHTERLLGVAMTDRNWRTVDKLLEMAQRLEV